jgi:Uma2 family endonuclease
MTTKTRATVADYRKLPEGARYELVDGEIIEKENPDRPGPRIKHQAISTRLVIGLGRHIVEDGLGLLLHAPADVYFDEENAYQPDILLVSEERVDTLVKEDGVYGAPDLVIEILSPSTGYYDLKSKFQVYEKHGVREYFIVDPKDDEVIGYRNQGGTFNQFFRQRGRLRSALLDCEISF